MRISMHPLRRNSRLMPIVCGMCGLVISSSVMMMVMMVMMERRRCESAKANIFLKG